MKIHLDSARSGPFEWEETLSFAAATMGCAPGAELAPVEVGGRLEASESDLWLELEVSSRVVQPCDRCGKAASGTIQGSSRMLVERRRGRASGGELELSEQDLGILEVAGDELDSEPLVAELVQLEMPARPLCREDCRGLCASCGEDRNERACDCESEATDPRWSALAELKGRSRAPI